MNVPYQSATFTISCAAPKQFPPATGPEVAFAGRSNSGKSSTLNRLCQQRKLAHVSKTPGRTQMINFFALASGAQLVDLPGYGFAKVPERERRKWGQLIEAYLQGREALQGLVIVMDIRRPLTDFDWQMLGWCGEQRLPVHLLLNKADKLKRGAMQKALSAVERQLAEADMDVTVQVFSAAKGLGLDRLYARLDEWLMTAAET
jgi:GTP-binding protein